MNICMRPWTHTRKLKLAILRMYSMSSYRDEILSILNYRALVTFMKYFAFQSHDAKFHNRYIILLHWLIWLTGNIHRHTKTQKVTMTFSVSHQTLVKGDCSRLAMQRGHNRAPFNSSVCVKVCVCACLWGKTEAGNSLKRWRVVAVFHRFDIIREQCLVFLRSTLDNKGWTIQCWGSAVPTAATSSVSQLTQSLSHLNTDRKTNKKSRHEKINLQEKLEMCGVNKTAQTKQKKRISFDFGQNLIRNVSHWKGIRTTFHRLPLAKRIPSLFFPKQKLN